MEIRIGDKIKFKSEKHRYTVKACDSRFVIATKPFNCQKTYLYTIIDLETKQRSSDNWYCKYDYENPDEAAKAIPELQSGKIELSYRRAIDLDIERIDHAKK